MEVEEDLSIMATLFWADGRVGEQMGKKSSRERGESESVKCRHEDRSEGLQERSCAKTVTLTSSGHRVIEGQVAVDMRGGLSAGSEADASEPRQDGLLQVMGSTSMSVRRRKKARTVTGCSLSVMEGSQKPDPRGKGEMGINGQDVEGRLEMTKRCLVASAEWK